MLLELNKVVPGVFVVCGGYSRGFFSLNNPSFRLARLYPKYLIQYQKTKPILDSFCQFDVNY